MAPACLEGPELFRHPLAVSVVEVLAKHGYKRAQVADMVSRAGSSSEEFARLFASKEDAMLRVFAASIEDFKAAVGRAFASRPEWPDNLRLAAYEAARWMRSHQAAARFMLVGAFEAGERAMMMREELAVWGARLIDVGRGVAPDPEAIPAGAPLIAIGATAEILGRQVATDREIRPSEILPQLMYAAVRPYLGAEAARRELDTPVPEDLWP